MPIYQTVAYEFDSADHGAALFNLEVEGFRYSRISNPTNAVLEQRVADARRRRRGARRRTGQAALHYAIANLADHGGNIVSVPQLYGTTHTLFAHVLPRQGINVRFAETDSADAIERLIDDDTRAVFCESVGNPAGNICDIEALADVAHKHGVPLIVDNTVATPDPAAPDRVRRRHRRAFADQIHGRPRHDARRRHRRQRQVPLGGARAALPDVQRARRIPITASSTPSISAPTAYIARCRSVYQRTTGAVLSPLSAFLLLQGIETVALRVERHVENARKVAEFLRGDPRVAWVNYAGFPDSPYHALAQKYLGGRASSLLTFGVKGGLEAGKSFYDALKLIKRLVNIGDAKSLACHPASTTHRQMPAEEQLKAGVRPEMIRLSIGIEHIDDIIEDLDQALDASKRADERLAGRGVRRSRDPAEKCPSCLWSEPPDDGVPPQAGHRLGPCRSARRRRSLHRDRPRQQHARRGARGHRAPVHRVLRAAAERHAVRLHLFSLPEIPRGEAAHAHLKLAYAPIESSARRGSTRSSSPATSRAPRRSIDEPYWHALTAVVDWAEHNTISTIWSCLAAHAAVLHLDGVKRHGSPRNAPASSPVTSTKASLFSPAPRRPSSVPHSRCNELRENELVSHGYRVLSRSKQAGVDMFVKQWQQPLRLLPRPSGI